MNWILGPEIIQAVGAIIVATTLAQALISLVATVRRLADEIDARQASLQALKLQTDEELSKFHHRIDSERLAWNGYRKFEIQRKTLEIAGIHSFHLVPHDGKRLPPFQPGQFMTFELRVPDTSRPVIRCYSLSDSPGKDHYRVSIKKIPPPASDPDGRPGLSSTYFNDVLNEGDIVDAKAPSGHFHLQDQKDFPTVLVAGGIGLTPVLSMLNAICEEPHMREVWLFYGIRNSNEHFMKSHLEGLAREHENFHLRTFYSQPLPTDTLGREFDHAGHIGLAVFKDMLPSNNYAFYVCGPAPMMESVTQGLEDWGVPKSHIHFEAFGKATVQRASKPEAATSDPAAEVIFDRSGKTLQWHDDDGSLLDFAESNGVTIDFACRTGNCGTCITAIKEGDVEYLVEPGHTPETGSCLACISVPKGTLILDA